MPERRALYLRYRSQTFAELVGQEPVARTLRNAISRGQVAHAYLLAGPRGTGKTSTARLIAKAVNCVAQRDGEPCDECESCVAIREGRFLDLIEIDAASNRSIDDVRDLRDKVRFAPSQGRYKVYVVDEVHQLSGDAFNALLKTLEEPPAHVIFVLATTEAHKVPATIVSRTQRFELRRIPHRAVVDTLRRICERESFACDDAALEAIARHANGSLRDAESILDQVATFAEGKVTREEVATLLGLPDWEEVSELFDAIAANDGGKAVAVLGRLVEEGRDLREFARRAIEHTRALVVANATGAAPAELGEQAQGAAQRQARAFPLTRLARIARRLGEAELQLRSSEGSPLPLELAVLELASDGTSPAPQSTTRARPAAQSTPPRATAPPPQPASRERVVDLKERREQRREATVETTEPPAYPLESAVAAWPGIIERFRARSIGIAAHLAQAEPLAFQGRLLVLGFNNEFARAKVAGDGIRLEVERTLEELVGPGVRVRCVLRRAESSDDPMLRAALETLGRPDRILDVE